MLRLASKKFIQKSSIRATSRFSNFLKEELAAEAEQTLAPESKHLSNAGFSIKTSGPTVQLSKNIANHSTLANVIWSVNNSVPDLNATEEGQEPVSYPDFKIELTKSKSNQIVEFECYFPDDIPDNELEFAIRSVSVVDNNLPVDAESYSINTDNVDPDTYDEFKTYLEDLGFDKDFGNDIIDFSTDYEGSQYLKSLEDLKKFVDA